MERPDTIETDYVERCVEALERSAAAIVGGPLLLAAATPKERAIEAAMTSPRLGAAPAEFRRRGGEPRFVDTVYLGAYRVDTVRRLGCYDESFGGNEDAELAWRAQSAGGVYLDPAIRSTYAVREGLGPLWRQFRRYGKARAKTMRKHPTSVTPRQLAVPALVATLLSTWRRPLFAAYVAMILARAASNDKAASWRSTPRSRRRLSTMHRAHGNCWGSWRDSFAQGIRW